MYIEIHHFTGVVDIPWVPLHKNNQFYLGIDQDHIQWLVREDMFNIKILQSHRQILLDKIFLSPSYVSTSVNSRYGLLRLN